MRIAPQPALFFAASLVLLTSACVATDEDIRLVEQDIGALRSDVNQLTIQQQNIDANVAQELAAINKRLDSVDQRLTAVETAIDGLSRSDDETDRRISDIDSQLDDRAINWALKHWLTYAVAVVILLIGISIGVWGHRIKVRSASAREAILTDSDEASDSTAGDGGSSVDN